MRKVIFTFLVLFFPLVVFAGSQTFFNPGTYTFTVPTYGTLTVQVWGAGASGGGSSLAGNAGATSSFSTVIAGGGHGGGNYTNKNGGAGGTASGGDTNTSGNSGGPGTLWASDGGATVPGYTGTVGSYGGSAPNGGSGGSFFVMGASAGDSTLPPGGGGTGTYTGYYTYNAPPWWYTTNAAGGGGSGAYASITYSSGALTAGSSVTVVVGAGGNGYTLSSGSGADGEVHVTWSPDATTTVILTSGSTWTVPADWNNSANTIEVIGGGGSGQDGGGNDGGAGGGGGAYSKISNLTLTPGTHVSYSVGAAGVDYGANGGNTWFDGTTYAGSLVAAQGGGNGGSVTDSIGGLGGSASAGIGTLKYSGAAGGTNNASAGVGGGGAAGPHGNGVIANTIIPPVSENYGNGGAGDAGYGGAGGFFSADGVNGDEIGGGVGAGSGGVGGGTDCSGNASPGGDAGNYGGGGGGGQTDPDNNCDREGGSGGAGAPGVIVIRYSPLSIAPTCSVTLSPNPIDNGQTSTLSWTTTNSPQWLYINSVGYMSTSTSSGSFSVSPSSTTSYTCTVADSQGNQYSFPANATLTVYQLPMCTLAVSPSAIIRGNSATLTYSSANVTSFSITPSIGTVTQNATATASVSPTTNTTYTGSASGPGGTASCTVPTGSTATVNVSCNAATSYSCNGLQTITQTSTSTSCVVTTNNNYASCTLPGFCLAGDSTCYYTSPDPVPTGSQTGNLTLHPSLIPAGKPVTVYWDIQQGTALNCSVSGSNGDGTSASTDTASPGLWNTMAGPETSSPIEQQTIYTLSCLQDDGHTIFTEHATVNVVPTYEER